MSATDAVLSAARLTAVAFRLRDDNGLTEALRKLVSSVNALEVEEGGTPAPASQAG